MPAKAAKPPKSKEGPVRTWPAIRAFRSLLGAYSVVIEAHRRHLETAYGLALGEFDMVAELGNTEGLRMGALAQKMITSPANVTRIAAQLEERGWVQRRCARAPTAKWSRR